jgi:hypothetical protein
MAKMLPLFSKQDMGERNGAAVRHDKLIMLSVFHPGETCLFPSCDPPQLGKLKVSKAGNTPNADIPGTRCVIPAVVGKTRYEGSGPPTLGCWLSRSRSPAGCVKLEIAG